MPNAKRSCTQAYKRKEEKLSIVEKSMTDEDDSIHAVYKKNYKRQKKTENENGSLQSSVGTELAIELEKEKSVNENLNETKCLQINEKVGGINEAEERTFLLNNNVIEKTNSMQFEMQSFEDVFSESKTEMEKDYFDNEEHYQYQEKLLNEKEWPGIKQKFNAYKSYFLIKEFYRLVPYKMDPYVSFHALNMPDVKIHSVAFVGTVVNIRTRAQNKYVIFTVSDGTGAIEINYKRENLEKEVLALKKINEKHKRFAKVAVAKKPWLKDEFLSAVPRSTVAHKTIPPFEYHEEIPLKYKLKLQHDWWLETRGGLYGKSIEVGDYLYIEGYCAFDFDRSSRPKDVTLNSLLSGKIIINGTYVKCITEDEYNSNLQTWLSDHVKSRYCAR